MVFELSELNSM